MSWWFLLVLAILAITASAVALSLSVRARRDARAARREVTQPPLLTPEAAPLPRPGDNARFQDEIDRLEEGIEQQGRRLSDLEARLAEMAAEARARPAAPVSARHPEASPPSPSARARVQTHLVAQGYEDPVLIERPGDDRVWTIETRRRGLGAKGTARILDDGRLEIRLEPVTRVFP